MEACCPAYRELIARKWSQWSDYRQLIATMNIRLIWSSVLFGGMVLSHTTWAFEDADIELQRPIVLFEEGFETSLIELVLNGVMIESVEGSQQLVVRSETLEWESNEISLVEPLLTGASIDLLVAAGSSVFQTGDRVRVFANYFGRPGGVASFG